MGVPRTHANEIDTCTECDLGTSTWCDRVSGHLTLYHIKWLFLENRIMRCLYWVWSENIQQMWNRASDHIILNSSLYILIKALQTLYGTAGLQNIYDRHVWCVITLPKNWCTVTLKQYVVYHIIVLTGTLEIQYIAVRYFAISSISRIVRGPQIYHDHKKKKISKCFFYLIWKKKKNDCNSLRYWFFAHIQTRNRVTHYDQTIQLVSISTQIDNNWQSININRRTCHNQCHNWVHVLSAQSINDVWGTRILQTDNADRFFL